jgi:hypothetical protein
LTHFLNAFRFLAHIKGSFCALCFLSLKIFLFPLITIFW